MTHFLTLDPTRASQLRAYLNAINNGAEFEKAAAAFGDLDQLDRDLRRYHANRTFEYKAVPLERDYAANAKVRELRPAEAALIKLAIEFTTPMKTEEAQILLDKIRVETARFPGDPFAQELLTQAELDMDNLDQADTSVSKWIMTAPNSARAHYYKGAILQKRHEVGGVDRYVLDEIRSSFTKAISLDPRDPLPKIGLYDSYVTRGNRPPSAVVDGLIDAMYSVPQVESVRLKVAGALIANNAPSDAIYILRPLAFDPHGGEAANVARKMISDILSNKNG